MYCHIIRSKHYLSSWIDTLLKRDQGFLVRHPLPHTRPPERVAGGQAPARGSLEHLIDGVRSAFLATSRNPNVVQGQSSMRSQVGR